MQMAEDYRQTTGGNVLKAILPLQHPIEQRASVLLTVTEILTRHAIDNFGNVGIGTTAPELVFHMSKVLPTFNEMRMG